MEGYKKKNTKINKEVKISLLAQIINDKDFEKGNVEHELFKNFAELLIAATDGLENKIKVQKTLYNLIKCMIGKEIMEQKTTSEVNYAKLVCEYIDDLDQFYEPLYINPSYYRDRTNIFMLRKCHEFCYKNGIDIWHEIETRQKTIGFIDKLDILSNLQN